MNSSIILAQVLGIFFSIVGLSMVANSKGAHAAIEASVENKGILWLWGIIALVIGATIVTLANDWTLGMPLIIAAIGWIAIVKGVFISIFPESAASLYRKFSSRGILMFCGFIAIIIGLVLLYL